MCRLRDNGGLDPRSVLRSGRARHAATDGGRTAATAVLAIATRTGIATTANIDVRRSATADGRITTITETECELAVEEGSTINVWLNQKKSVATVAALFFAYERLFDRLSLFALLS